MTSNRINFVHPAVIAVWAAIIAAGHFFPTIPILGTGGTFSLSSALFPLSGIFFGPIAGSLCSAAGGFIGNLIAPYTAWMGPFTFIIGMTTSFTSGCIAWSKGLPVVIKSNGSFIFNGGILVYLIGTILWFTQKIGQTSFFIPVFIYGLGFTIMICGFIFSQKFFLSPSRLLKFLAVWICSFGGIIGGATAGNFFTLVLYEMPNEFWKVMVFVQPLERAIFATGAMLIGVPLLEGFKKIGISAGPQNNEN
jgi:uncharacterized membrane protein